jgi:hypothetical protein
MILSNTNKRLPLDEDSSDYDDYGRKIKNFAYHKDPPVIMKPKDTLVSDNASEVNIQIYRTP